MNRQVSVILLAGGKASRMGGNIPKQYITLGDKPIALHSFDSFLKNPWVKEIVVVCEDEYQSLFKSHCPSHYPLYFAKPGQRRQDSVYSGLKTVHLQDGLVAVHDSARPFVPSLDELFESAFSQGASVLGAPMKFTVKESTPSRFVSRTLKRENLWEIQTPQVATKELLEKGFTEANEQKLTVTDDVSLVELIGHPVKIVEGPHTNIKITTPDDLIMAQKIYEEKVQTTHCL